MAGLGYKPLYNVISIEPIAMQLHYNVVAPKIAA